MENTTVWVVALIIIIIKVIFIRIIDDVMIMMTRHAYAHDTMHIRHNTCDMAMG